MAELSTTTLIIQGLVTIAGGSSVAGIVTALLSRRKTQAEANKTQAETGKTFAETFGTNTNTASQQVDTAMDMLREVRTDLATVKTELAAQKKWRASAQDVMDAHNRWDAKVWNVLQRAGIEIEEPPPLRVDDAV